MTLPTKEQVEAVYEVVFHVVISASVIAFVVVGMVRMLRDYWNHK